MRHVDRLYDRSHRESPPDGVARPDAPAVGAGPDSGERFSLRRRAAKECPAVESGGGLGGALACASASAAPQPCASPAACSQKLDKGRVVKVP